MKKFDHQDFQILELGSLGSPGTCLILTVSASTGVGRPQSSPGLSWPVLSAWDRGSCLFLMHTLTLVEADDETLLPLGGYLAIANDCSYKVTDHGGTRVVGCSYHLHHYAYWPGAMPAFIWEIAFLTILVVIGMGRPSTGGSSDKWSRSE